MMHRFRARGLQEAMASLSRELRLIKVKSEVIARKPMGTSIMVSEAHHVHFEVEAFERPLRGDRHDCTVLMIFYCGCVRGVRCAGVGTDLEGRGGGGYPAPPSRFRLKTWAQNLIARLYAKIIWGDTHQTPPPR